MKNRVGLVILVLACVVLGILFLTTKRDAVKQQTKATETIVGLSNEVTRIRGKWDEQKQVAALLEKDLQKQKESFTELTNNYSQVSTDLAKTQTDLKAREEEIKQRDAKISDLENQNQALDKQAADLSNS